MRALISRSRLPSRNAAMEDFLYRARRPREEILLLYRNAPCIVIGRNQNPCQEIDAPFCHAARLPVLRRLSGGGAVYHDLQNLNYSFFVPKEEFQPERFIGAIVRLLRKLGIPATEYGQHSIQVGHSKVSGNASALSGQNALLHGCLLVRSNLQHLRNALRPPENVHFTGAATKSVPATVQNLSSFLPGLSAESLEQILAHEIPGSPPEEIQPENMPGLDELTAKYESDAWNWDRTPPFLASCQEHALRHTRENPHGLRQRWNAFLALAAKP